MTRFGKNGQSNTENNGVGQKQSMHFWVALALHIIPTMNTWHFDLA